MNFLLCVATGNLFSLLFHAWRHLPLLPKKSNDHLKIGVYVLERATQKMTNDVTKKVTFHRKNESAEKKSTQNDDSKVELGARPVLHRRTNFTIAKMLQLFRVSEIDDASG